MKSVIPIITFLILLSGGNICNAQRTTIDSLQNLLSTAKEDTNKVNILYQLSEACAEEDILKYAMPALQLAEQLNFKKGMAQASNNVGYAYNNLGELNKALQYYQNSLRIYEELGNKGGVANLLNNIAVIYNNQGDISKGLAYHQKSLQMQKEVGNKEGVATSLNNIGFIYNNQGNIPAALEYYHKSLRICEEIGHQQGVATSYNNISALYESQGDRELALEYDQKSLKIAEEIGYKFGIARSLSNIGLYYEHQGNFALALQNFREVLKIYEEIGNKSALSITLKNMGFLYKNQGDFPQALTYYHKSLQIQQEVGDKRLIAAVLNDIGNIYLQQKNYKQAVAYCSQALQVAQALGNPESIRGATGNLSEIYAAEGKYREAYQMQVLFKQMADSVSNVETRKATVKKQMQYEFDKKEAVMKAEQKEKDFRANAEIKRQTLIRNTTLGGVGLAGIFSFLLVRSFTRRRKTAFDKQVLETEMKALRSQMNPHFIFNSLHSINKYMIDNDKENASEYLSKFSKLMRLILENSREQEVPLEKDLSALELYLQLESLRFQNMFHYNIKVDAQIDTENTLIPPMLLQPFVENAIIHGIQHKGDGIINIKITKEDNMIRYIVEDNGIGRKQLVQIETGEEKKRESLGMKITQERLNIINQLKKVKAAINIFDLKDAENQSGGVRIELLLPFEQAF